MASARPTRVVAVVGTGTEVGKTVVAAALLGALRRHGKSVAARKPTQSFDPFDPAETDAQILALASGESEHEVTATSFSYPAPLAPPMAAISLGVEPPTLIELLAACRWPAGDIDVGVVELAGGVCSPHAADGDGLDLLVALAPDQVVVVADAGLGTINQVRLTTQALFRALGGVPTLVVLNRFDGDDAVHRANRTWLAERDNLDVVTLTDRTGRDQRDRIDVEDDVWSWAKRLG